MKPLIMERKEHKLTTEKVIYADGSWVFSAYFDVRDDGILTDGEAGEGSTEKEALNNLFQSFISTHQDK
jgi:hypothetical protein